MQTYGNFSTAIAATGAFMRTTSYEVRGTRWQSTDVSDKPEMRMREILNLSYQVVMPEQPALDLLRLDIKPNLPWADHHFEERVGGEPVNPGQTWLEWPWSNHADKFRIEEGGKFSHTYMERYWPFKAGGGENVGIRYQYGDLNDVVNHLLRDPLSRQAYLPVWFPEDTGVVHGERVPCSLGYHWILRNGYLHTSYYIRSCDFVRHYRDDLYLTARLTMWLLEQLRARELISRAEENLQPIDLETWPWRNAKLGLFAFHCVSMHMFINDWNKLYGGKP